MPLSLPQPITYLITSGETTPRTTPASEDFRQLLALVRAAVYAGVSLIQLREKHLRPHTLYELTARAAEITGDSPTRLLVNDRADIARAAGADGVHLAANSLEPHIIRQAFGTDFLIGVSTHTLDQARSARDLGADFAVLGPIFKTPSKRGFGPPLGPDKLREAARALAPFPLLALGGVTLENAHACLRAGARGIAAIRLLNDADHLKEIVGAILNGPE
ncbi:MAG TPA: thiamine phosphate synthase [Pyrinomonadaceae bacterium]|jgi:thiamine-phosphate pyrophosphorylase